MDCPYENSFTGECKLPPGKERCPNDEEFDEDYEIGSKMSQN